MNTSNTFDRPVTFSFANGEKASLPFSDAEYLVRQERLRRSMDALGIDAVLLTSMHNIAYYTGFLYCAFGRPYGCVVTSNDCITLSANIDGGQPYRRSVSGNLVYTDWQRDNYWRGVKHLVGSCSRLGVEYDHLTLSMQSALATHLDNVELVDVASSAMQQRMVKSDEEITLIRQAAQVADLGGHAIRDAIRAGVSEAQVAMIGRDAMEVEIERRFPHAEYRDTWVWFQSGLNTDGAHNPVTSRLLQPGDILSLNAFPMISGYYTALERTLFLGEPDPRSLQIWQANVEAHELGLSLIRPGVRCDEICAEINDLLASRDLLQYRSFGYGHSFGVLCHYYGREAGLELREDISTTLEPGMVVSIEPMLTIPEGVDGAGGYREHDILVVTESGADNITGFPYGPDNNIVDCG